MGGQATPPADESVLRFEELPTAGGRTAVHAIVRQAGPMLVFTPGGGGGQ